MKSRIEGNLFENSKAILMVNSKEKDVIDKFKVAISKERSEEGRKCKSKLFFCI